jgi:3',5'-nucleoside bisphosphate phosphatase
MAPVTDTVATDLHGHSCYSDGRATPEDYVRFRASIGMQVIALSDHDTFAGVPRAAAAAREAGVVLVPAMEATSFIGFGTGAAEQVHVLAYFPPARLGALDDTFLGRRAALLHARWKAFVLAWMDGLAEHDRLAIDHTGELASAPAAEFPALQSMINRVFERNRILLESFHRHHVRFWDDAELFAWEPEALIEAIRADGALDVVAHANRVRDKERMARVLDHASGVEVYTSRHKAPIAARYLAYAESRGKYWTASSEDHQHGDYLRPPCGTPRATVERILGGPGAEARAASA